MEYDITFEMKKYTKLIFTMKSKLYRLKSDIFQFRLSEEKQVLKNPSKYNTIIFTFSVFHKNVLKYIKIIYFFEKIIIYIYVLNNLVFDHYLTVVFDYNYRAVI